MVKPCAVDGCRNAGTVRTRLLSVARDDRQSPANVYFDLCKGCVERLAAGDLTVSSARGR